MIDIQIPAVGESITEATIAEWSYQPGDWVEVGVVLFSLETDKANVEIVAESAGVLSITAQEGDTVQVGQTVGQIDPDAARPAGQIKETAATPVSPTPPPPTPAIPPSPSSANHSATPLSPAVRKMVGDHQLDPTNIPGTGKGGRLTKGDITQALSRPATTSPPTPSKKTTDAEGVSRTPMSRIRKTIARRLVEAQQTAAILTTFNEIDMSAAIELRSKYKEQFKSKHGVNLGFTSLFVRAATAALQSFPDVNSQIDGDEIITRDHVNMGVAVSTEKGLLVPVIKHVDKMTLPEIELAIRHYSAKARDRKISLDDLSDGTFTVSNGGVFGSLMSTPILNPPQSGILGLHKIEKRPIVIDDQIAIRPMMYVALSYDHRIIDGKESVGFLVKIKEGLEDPSMLLLDI